MNVSNHGLERYCERILGMTDTKEIKKYVAENKETLISAINNLFEGSGIIYTGKLGSANYSHYYIKDNLVFVANNTNDCIITLYKIDFGFPETTNIKVIKDLKMELDKLNKKLNKEKNKQQNEIDKKNIEVENIDIEIQGLEERLDFLKYKRNTLREEINVIVKETDYLEDKIKKYAYQLCNSLDYRKDMQRLA